MKHPICARVIGSEEVHAVTELVCDLLVGAVGVNVKIPCVPAEGYAVARRILVDAVVTCVKCQMGLA